MPQTDELQGGPITSRMTLLEVMNQCPLTEAVFAAYENQGGVCLRCQALSDTLAEAAKKYSLDLNKLLGDLNAIVRALESSPEILS